MQDDPGDKFSRYWSPVLLITLQIFTLPQTGSSYRGWCLSITLQRWLIMLAGWWMLLELRAHLLTMPFLLNGQTPHWVPNVLQWYKPLSPGTLGNLTSHLCWAWLAGSGWEYMQGIIYQQMTQRGTTFNFCNIY